MLSYPLVLGRSAHIFGVHGFQRADKDRNADKDHFCARKKFLETANLFLLLATSMSCLLKITGLAICMEPGGWVDRPSLLVRVGSPLTRVNLTDHLRVPRRDFLVGCLLAQTFGQNCWVDRDMFKPHLCVKVLLDVGRWDV